LVSFGKIGDTSDSIPQAVKTFAVALPSKLLTALNDLKAVMGQIGDKKCGGRQQQA